MPGLLIYVNASSLKAVILSNRSRTK